MESKVKGPLRAVRRAGVFEIQTRVTPWARNFPCGAWAKPEGTQENRGILDKTCLSRLSIQHQGRARPWSQCLIASMLGMLCQPPFRQVKSFTENPGKLIRPQGTEVLRKTEHFRSPLFLKNTCNTVLSPMHTHLLLK